MLLTVVVPAYNVANYIQKTLLSLINQRSIPIEIIVVDDGSTDDTSVIATKLFDEKGFKSGRVIRQPNAGVAAARNRGLAEAKGTYVYFLDADDYVDPNFSNEVGLSITRSPKADVLCWAFDTVDENGKRIKSYEGSYPIFSRDLTGMDTLREILINKCMWIWTGSAAYRRSFLEKNGLQYSRGCTNGEDQEFTFKALAHAKQVVFLAKVLSYYVQRRGSITNSFNVKKFDAVYAMLRTGEYLKNLNKPVLDEVSEVLLNEKVLMTYIGNYMSCLRHLRQEGHSAVSANKFLKDIINEEYPELVMTLNRKLRKRTGSMMLDVTKLLFTISPTLCGLLYGLRDKLRLVN